MTDLKYKAKKIEVSVPSEVPKDLKVPAGINANYGDVLRWDGYRMVESYIVGDDNNLIRNPDLLLTGYLSIPLEITKKFSDASWVYSDFDRLWLVSIELRYDDVFIRTHFGDLPKDWSYNLWTEQIHSPYGHLVIDFPNNKSKYYLPGKHKAENIRAWYIGSLKPQSNFFVRVKLEHQYLKMYREKYPQLENYNCYTVPDSELPPTWTGLAKEGTSGVISGVMNGKSYYEGPKEDEELAKEAIKKFFAGFEGFIRFFTESKEDVLETINQFQKWNV